MTDVARAWLTADEVHDLTARVRWSAQRRALAAMGVPFRPNAAGRPLVEAAAVLRYRERPARTCRSRITSRSVLPAALRRRRRR